MRKKDIASRTGQLVPARKCPQSGVPQSDSLQALSGGFDRIERRKSRLKRNDSMTEPGGQSVSVTRRAGSRPGTSARRQHAGVDIIRSACGYDTGYFSVAGGLYIGDRLFRVNLHPELCRSS